jgi:hypothetical protein
MQYQFRNNPSTGRRYSIWVERFITDIGTRPVLEWFDTMEDAIQAAEEMKQDGRFFGICSYVRSQQVADCS